MRAGPGGNLRATGHRRLNGPGSAGPRLSAKKPASGAPLGPPAGPSSDLLSVGALEDLLLLYLELGVRQHSGLLQLP